MKIGFTPVRMEVALEASVLDSNHIVVNGEVLDFSPLQEGETIDAVDVGNPWVSGTVARVGGELYITLIAPHGPNAPYETRFPSPGHITVDRGAIPIPAYDARPTEEVRSGN